MSQIPSPKLHNGRFTEETLREQVHAVWGAHGAHADILDRLISRALPAVYVLVERSDALDAAAAIEAHAYTDDADGFPDAAQVKRDRASRLRRAAAAGNGEGT